jgi:hypothetical protein
MRSRHDRRGEIVDPGGGAIAAEQYGRDNHLSRIE